MYICMVSYRMLHESSHLFACSTGAWVATKLLQQWPYKTAVVDALMEYDLIVRINYVIGFFVLYILGKLIHK
jgi:hypothetical protein